MDTILLSPTHLPYQHSEYQDHIAHKVPSQLSTEYRPSWEERSERESMEMRDLPSAITPRPMWKDDVSIDIASEETSTSASETDELFGHLEDDLHLTRHDQDWEVRMLARELEKREFKEKETQQNNKLRSDSIVQKAQLLNVRSLEERCTLPSIAAPSLRSISSDNIYNPSVVYGNTPPVFTYTTSVPTRTTSISPDVVTIPAVTTSDFSQQSTSGS